MASLRNYCAHHARIWNRNYPVTPDIPANLPETWLTNTKVPFNKLYAQLCCIAYLLNSIEPQNTFAADIKALLSKSAIVDPAAMGFIKDWEMSLYGYRFHLYVIVSALASFSSFASVF